MKNFNNWWQLIINIKPLNISKSCNLKIVPVPLISEPKHTIERPYVLKICLGGWSYFSARDSITINFHLIQGNHQKARASHYKNQLFWNKQRDCEMGALLWHHRQQWMLNCHDELNKFQLFGIQKSASQAFLALGGQIGRRVGYELKENQGLKLEFSRFAHAPEPN